MAGNASAQSDSTIRQEVDSLIEGTNVLSHDSQMLKSVGEEILDTAGRIDYTKGLAYGNLLLARHLHLTGHYDKSISSLEQVQKENKDLHSVPRLNAYLYLLYSQNHLFVGLRSAAKQYLHKALYWAREEQPNSIQKEKLIADIYRKFMGQFSRVEQADSVRYYINKYEKLNLEHIRPNETYTNIMRGRIYFLDGEIDSAYHYYMKGYKQIDNKKNHSYAISLLGLGRIDYQKKNYNQGIQHFLEGLQHAPFPAIEIAFYKHLADSYAKLGELSKKHHYLNRYKAVQDSFQAVNRTRRGNLFRHYKKSQKYNKQDTSSTNTKAHVFVFLAAVLVAGGLFFFYRKNKRVQTKLSKQQKKTESLEQKVNTAFEEVIQLAKENDSSFLARFREVYSERYQKLTDLEPSLTKSELSFCVMIWLGFSTKEIARYTHIQPKSVQMKKYRLRKKMDLPKGKDLYEWVKNL